jgi:predicted nucleic acid-binding protein
VIAFDTNILVYAVDTLAGERHNLALKLVDESLQAPAAYIPAQACRACSRKRRSEPTTALAAIGAHRSDGIPIWDALVWAVCERAGVEVLVSEDFQNRRRLGQVAILDPFDPKTAGSLGLP